MEEALDLSSDRLLNKISPVLAGSMHDDPRSFLTQRDAGRHAKDASSEICRKSSAGSTTDCQTTQPED